MARPVLFTCLTFLIIVSGCSLPPKVTLADINPVRTYKAERGPLFDAVREFATKEAYKVERFELESGAIKAHKILSTRSSGTARSTTSETRHVIMTLKVKELSAGMLEVMTNFTYGDYQGTYSSEDEGMLVSEYNNLFSYLEEQFKK